LKLSRINGLKEYKNFHCLCIDRSLQKQNVIIWQKVIANTDTKNISKYCIIYKMLLKKIVLTTMEIFGNIFHRKIHRSFLDISLLCYYLVQYELLPRIKLLCQLFITMPHGISCITEFVILGINLFVFVQKTAITSAK